ncbi:hypothetical protein ACH4LN_07465 [Streptomyces albus]|uniref:hypothetical protein n=1 Tax=Streptomyces albus TaxID=1888 RepID=UPI00378BF1DA
MLQPQQRAPRLGVIALASTVGLIAALPLAAAVAGEDARLAAKAFEAAQPRQVRSGPERPASFCGRESTAPEGVSLRTCVRTQGAEVWARAAYRNATRSPLPAVLTLRGPDGRTVRVHCTLQGDGRHRTCETKRTGAREVRGEAAVREAYTAVAEVSSPEGERRWLRAGSNSPAVRRS